MTVDNAWHRSGLALCEPSRVLLAGRGVLLVLLFFLSLLPLSSRSFPSLATLYASYYDTLYASLALLTRHLLAVFLTLFQHVLLSAAGNATAVPRLSSF